MADWYSFRPYAGTTMTIVAIDGEQALMGARATRYFEKCILARADAQQVVRKASARMPYVYQRWPDWRKVRKVDGIEKEILLAALMLAMGRPEKEIDRFEKRGEPAC